MVGAEDIPGNPDNLDRTALETVGAVVGFYGDKTAQWLSDLTHSEAPWRDARKGLSDGAGSQEEITLAAMDEYYSSLAED